MNASRYDHFPVVKYLLEKYADVNFTDTVSEIILNERNYFLPYFFSMGTLLSSMHAFMIINLLPLFSWIMMLTLILFLDM